jgi:hypothetical protein
MTSIVRAGTRRPGKRRAPRFCICLSNEGHSASLEVRKVYRRLVDADAEAEGLLRVIDESGESYLYPRAAFGDVTLEPKVARALARTA